MTEYDEGLELTIHNWPLSVMLKVGCRRSDMSLQCHREILNGQFFI